MAATSTRSQRLPSWTHWLPAGLLVMGALGQGLRVQLVDANSWGGGATFAMFADIDHSATRYVQLELLVDQSWVPAALPEELSGAATRLRHLPSQANAAGLAADALTRPGWAAGADGVWHDTGDPGSTTTGSATAARAELWTAGLRDGHIVAELVVTAEMWR